MYYVVFIIVNRPVEYWRANRFWITCAPGSNSLSKVRSSTRAAWKALSAQDCDGVVMAVREKTVPLKVILPPRREWVDRLGMIRGDLSSAGWSSVVTASLDMCCESWCSLGTNSSWRPWSPWSLFHFFFHRCKEQYSGGHRIGRGR